MDGKNSRKADGSIRTLRGEVVAVGFKRVCMCHTPGVRGLIQTDACTPEHTINRGTVPNGWVQAWHEV